jgi:hypothetical protein
LEGFDDLADEEFGEFFNRSQGSGVGELGRIGEEVSFAWRRTMLVVSDEESDTAQRVGSSKQLTPLVMVVPGGPETYVVQSSKSARGDSSSMEEVFPCRRGDVLWHFADNTKSVECRGALVVMPVPR